jgi:hypothetical protein
MRRESTSWKLPQSALPCPLPWIVNLIQKPWIGIPKARRRKKVVGAIGFESTPERKFNDMQVSG